MTLLEATGTLSAAGLSGIRGFKTTSPLMGETAYELRSYQLRLGYSTVPSFLEYYGSGLPDKLAADGSGVSELVALLAGRSGASELVTLLYSDCGPLNMVLELWRHESIERSQDSRRASRAAHKWKEAVGNIAPLGECFTTQFLRPAPFSPLK